MIQASREEEEGGEGDPWDLIGEKKEEVKGASSSSSSSLLIPKSLACVSDRQTSVESIGKEVDGCALCGGERGGRGLCH